MFTIPDSVRIIDVCAIAYSKCTEIIIPANVISVTDKCFVYSIVTVIYFHGNTDILHNTFETTDQLTDIYYFGTRQITLDSIFQSDRTTFPTIHTCKGYKGKFAGLDVVVSEKCASYPDIKPHTCFIKKETDSFKKLNIHFI